MNRFFLPHAYPFLLVDRVLAVEPGVGATVARHLASSDPLIDGAGRLPPTLLLEAMAQCAGIAVAAGSDTGGGMLVSFDRFRTAGRVEAGDSLEITAKVARKFGAVVKARARIRANGRLRAAAELVLRVGS